MQDQAAITDTTNESNGSGLFIAVVSDWKREARGEWKGNLELGDRKTPIKCMMGAGAVPLAFLGWQFKLLLRSVGVRLELIGCDVAKYGFKSTRIFFPPSYRDHGIWSVQVFIIYRTTPTDRMRCQRSPISDLKVFSFLPYYYLRSAIAILHSLRIQSQIGLQNTKVMTKIAVFHHHTTPIES